MTHDLLDRLAERIPQWLGWPLSAASTVGAIAGAGLVFLGAATGSIAVLVWAAIIFVLAAVLWYAADIVQARRDPADF
jgi:hypothetical protein